jgi:hypothetical protein
MTYVYISFRFQEYLNTLKKKCESYIVDGFKLKLAKIFDELNLISKNYQKEISNEFKLIYEEKNIKSKWKLVFA